MMFVIPVSICKIGSEQGEDLLPPLWETLLTLSLLRLVFPGYMNPGHIAALLRQGPPCFFSPSALLTRTIFCDSFSDPSSWSWFLFCLFIRGGENNNFRLRFHNSYLGQIYAAKDDKKENQQPCILHVWFINMWEVPREYVNLKEWVWI